MDAKQVGLGALCLAASGAMLSWAGVPGGHLMLGVAGLGVVGPVASEVRDRATERRRGI